MSQMNQMSLTPEHYNIQLTRHGKPIDWGFQPAIVSDIARFGYIIPLDDRCKNIVIQAEGDVYTALEPVLGKGYKGLLDYKTKKQSVISLRDVAILGYQRQTITDPRLNNHIADMYEIYIDKRVFPMWANQDWLILMGKRIAEEQTMSLAQDIKDLLIKQAKGD